MSEDAVPYEGEFPAVTVGDLDSDAKGSGARRNSGKPPLELIPVRISLEMFTETGDLPVWLENSLHSLAMFQEGKDTAIFEALGPLAFHWTDIARVLDYGRQGKYKEWNWAKGMPWSVCFGCALRHAKAIVDGEDMDQDSGLFHAGHYGCNLVFLAHYVIHYREGDDRPKVFWAKDKDLSTEEKLEILDRIKNA